MLVTKLPKTNTNKCYTNAVTKLHYSFLGFYQQKSQHFYISFEFTTAWPKKPRGYQLNETSGFILNIIKNKYLQTVLRSEKGLHSLPCTNTLPAD